MAMSDLRDLGAARVRRTPPPALLDDIRTAGRRRLRLAALSGVTVSVVLSVGIAVGVGAAARAGGGDRLVPSEPQPSASVYGPHHEVKTVTRATPAAPGESTATGAGPVPGTQPSTPAGVPAATPYQPDPPTRSPAPTPTPTATADPGEPGVQDRTTVHRGLSACDVHTTPSGYCGRVTTTQGTGVVTIVTEVCWSNGNTDTGTLSFDSTLETDDVVSIGAKQVWDWADGKTFSAQTEQLSLQPGDCIDWTTQWTPDRDAPRTTYQVEGRSYASELPDGSDRWTATFTLA